MNIMEASNKLYEFFLTNDCFVMEENVKDIIKITDDPARDKACLLGALKSLASVECITAVDQGDMTYWFLNRPAEALDQDVTLHGFTAQMVAETINSFCEHIQDPTDLCDAKSIQEKDIRNLLFITNYFIGVANGDEQKG